MCALAKNSPGNGKSFAAGEDQKKRSVNRLEVSSQVIDLL
jgi:hypothetical protein